MLKDGKRRSLVFGNQVASRCNILQVVVGDFLALYLIEISVKIAKETPLLMRIFSVSKRLYPIISNTQSGAFSSIEIVEDGTIVARRHGKSSSGKTLSFFQRRVSLLVG